MNREAYDTIQTYISHNPIATLGTTSLDNFPHGAIVYVCADNLHPRVYFVTKQATRKYKNLIEHNQVSLTIVNPSDNSTLQASGRAFEVQDPITIDIVMQKIAHAHTSAKEWLPPIAKLRAGAYVIIGVELTNARLAQFKGMVIGDEHIFTKL